MTYPTNQTDPDMPAPRVEKVSFAWTPGAGSYKYYPPYVNLTGNRLSVRGPEVISGQHPLPGIHVGMDLPDEAIAELRAALAIESTPSLLREALRDIEYTISELLPNGAVLAGTKLILLQRKIDAALNPQGAPEGCSCESYPHTCHEGTE